MIINHILPGCWSPLLRRGEGSWGAPSCRFLHQIDTSKAFKPFATAAQDAVSSFEVPRFGVLSMGAIGGTNGGCVSKTTGPKFWVLYCWNEPISGNLVPPGFWDTPEFHKFLTVRPPFWPKRSLWQRQIASRMCGAGSKTWAQQFPFSVKVRLLRASREDGADRSDHSGWISVLMDHSSKE